MVYCYKNPDYMNFGMGNSISKIVLGKGSKYPLLLFMNHILPCLSSKDHRVECVGSPLFFILQPHEIS